MNEGAVCKGLMRQISISGIQRCITVIGSVNIGHGDKSSSPSELVFLNNHSGHGLLLLPILFRKTRGGSHNQQDLRHGVSGQVEI